MSLRGFFIWFWGIVLGSGIAAGATLAVLKAPAKPPAPAPLLAAAILQPLLPPPVPPLAAPQRDFAPWRPVHPTVIRPSLRPRPAERFTAQHFTEQHFAEQHFTEQHFAEQRIAAERITVVPPIPPQPELRAPVQRRVRTGRLAGPHRMARVETRTRIVTEEVSPEPERAEPERRAYSWYPGYPRYSFDAYAYPYPRADYPPRFAYYYRY